MYQTYKNYAIQKFEETPFPFYLYWGFLESLLKKAQNLEKQHKIEKKDYEKENPSYIEFT